LLGKNNVSAIDDLLEGIEDLESTGDKLKLVGELLGGSVGVKSMKEYKEIWNLIKSGKIRPSPVACLGAYIYLEGVEMGISSDQMNKVYNSYIQLHKNNPSGQQGVYIITSVMSMPSSGSPSGTNVIMTSSYYDIRTKKYLGSVQY
jgi:hypothetical protein